MSESLRAYIAALGLDEVWVMNALQEHGKCSDLCVEVEDVGNGGEVSELQAGLDDIEEYGTEEINAAVDLRHQLAAAMCERDEAREDAADWKVEYEIVAARLRGEKHPQDNGIIAKDEIIPKLIRERDEQTAQMCQAIGYLSTIAEDCEAWLNGESDEPSMEFIKAVRDYARKAINL